MNTVQLTQLPDDSLLQSYIQQGHFVDCYSVTVAGTITHAEFVTAFYTTPLFKVERMLLKWVLSKPSSDTGARQLADGSKQEFAAWRVEDRAENQLLLVDFQGRTRSWLMSTTQGTQQPKQQGSDATTRLFFGSAVMRTIHPDTGKPTMGRLFDALSGFHKLYSIALLRAAVRRLA